MGTFAVLWGVEPMAPVAKFMETRTPPANRPLGFWASLTSWRDPGLIIGWVESTGHTYKPPGPNVSHEREREREKESRD